MSQHEASHFYPAFGHHFGVSGQAAFWEKKLSKDAMVVLKVDDMTKNVLLIGLDAGAARVAFQIPMEAGFCLKASNISGHV